jgi:hypothetical protein
MFRINPGTASVAFCVACTLAAFPAGAADEARPTSVEELDKLPVGLTVTHYPQPALAAETPNAKVLSRYTWFFKTTVRATDGDVNLTEFGGYSQAGRTWVFNNITRKPFTPKDFDDWYACPKGALKKGKDYSDARNWVTSAALQAGKSRWYYVGVDGSGRRVKGEAVIDLKAEIDRTAPGDAAMQLPGGLKTLLEVARAR